MEKQHIQAPENDQIHEMESPLQAKPGRRQMAPPAFQLTATGGFPSVSGSLQSGSLKSGPLQSESLQSAPIQQTPNSEGPIQRVGRPTDTQEQIAGTCGLYSLTHAIAHLYRLDGAGTQLVRDLLLQAAGQVGADVTHQGEVTSFATAEAIVRQYNTLTTAYPVLISRQTVGENLDSEAGWRSDLGIDNEGDEAQHAVTMAVDSRLYAGLVEDALDFEVEAEDMPKGTKLDMQGSAITITGLSADNASFRGSSAHWVTITSIANDFIEVVDPNFPGYVLKFRTGEAALLSNSLAKDVLVKDYLNAVYGTDKKGKQKSAGRWVSEMSYQGKNQKKEKVYRNQDWATMMQEDVNDPRAYLGKIHGRLGNTDDTTTVDLSGLAIRVVKPGADE